MKIFKFFILMFFITSAFMGYSKKTYLNKPRACTATIYGTNSCGERVAISFTVVDPEGTVPYAALCAEAGVEAENMLSMDCLLLV